MRALPRKENRSVGVWTAQEDDFLRANWETMSGVQCAEVLGRANSSVYNRAKLLNLKRSKRSPIGSGRFEKGRSGNPSGRSKGSQRPSARRSLGGRPSNSWLPIGTERKKNANGVTRRKVSDTGDRDVDWRPVHELVYIEAHGPLEEGQYVWFVDKNTENLALDNLVAMTRSQAILRNSIQRYPKELRAVLHRIGAMKRVIKNRERKENESHNT